jgi:HEPN domain-containing protein
MKTLTQEWVEKAEADFNTAQREFRARINPNYDAVCFHAQQCVEKYLKSRLQEADIPFTKTHDLVVLLDLVLHLEPMWAVHRTGLRELSVAAVEIRYPGESADREAARTALTTCKDIRRLIRYSLGLGN